MKMKTSFVLTVAVVVLSSVGLSNAMVLGTIEYNKDGVDFEGYTIDSIALTVNELFIDYHEAGPDSYTNYSYDITYTIYGAPIPEPATVLLLGLGTVLLRGRRRV